MAALQIISLDTTTPRLRAPASGDTYSAPRAVDITPESLTGSAATSSLSIAQTWNTTGTPSAIDLNVTDTASNAASLLMNLRVGGTSRFYFGKDGSLAFGNDADSYFRAADTSGRTVDWFRDGVLIARFGAVCSFATSLGIGTTGSAQDVILARDAANTLAQRNGTAAQAFNIYNTYTDASNYERGFVRWSSNVLRIGTEAAGTGTARNTEIVAGAFTTTISATDGGASFGGAVRLLNANSRIELSEVGAPAAPAADRVRIYAEDNGSGKTRLMALFATGVAQQLAVEP